MASNPEPTRPADAVAPAPDSPLMSIVAALLFLYVGFWLAPVGISGNAIYDGSVAVFVWLSRVVGIGLLAVALLSVLRLPLALPLNFTLAALATAGCLVCGSIWLTFSDAQGVLILIFGLLNASATRGAWLQWRHR